MTLENVLLALRHSIKNELNQLDESLLLDAEVRNILTTFFAEQQTRPELTSLIRAPSLMHEYLNLSLDEREELEGFSRSYPTYLRGEEEGEELKGRPISVTKNISEKTLNFIRKQRFTVTFLKMFDFYLENREENEVFNTNYLRINNRLKKQFGNLGKNLYRNVSHNLKEEGGINYIVQLASQQRPDILQYWKYDEKKSRRSR